VTYRGHTEIPIDEKQERRDSSLLTQHPHFLPRKHWQHSCTIAVRAHRLAIEEPRELKVGFCTAVECFRRKGGTARDSVREGAAASHPGATAYQPPKFGELWTPCQGVGHMHTQTLRGVGPPATVCSLLSVFCVSS